MAKSGPKLTNIQKEAVLALITDLAVVRARNQEFIAKEIERQFGIELTQQQVSYYLKQLRGSWQRRTERNLNELRSEEEAHLLYIRNQALDAWDRSKVDRKMEFGDM